MRYIAAYFLTMFYLVIMLKPLIPVICDAWSHIFEEAEHISTIHAKYGSNHLEMDLAKSGADSDNSKHQNATRAEESSFTHLFIEECQYNFSFNSAKIDYCLLQPSGLPENILIKLAPPPKFG